MSDKVTSRHRRRKAILYIRQSTNQQVVHNEESRRLQYAMRSRIESLGWSEVEIIDDDLGRSAAGRVDRPGFERLVAQVSLGEVGAVAARELSRFARNSREWQQLLEVCRYVDTLLVDHDAVYDVRQSNDRLLLGLKGNLNEYELDLLRLRALEARNEKARRGEYVAKLPVGFRKSSDGLIEMTPDRRVRKAITLVFDKFLELGSARQAMLWFREQGLGLPVGGNAPEEISWKDARAGLFQQILTNPVYAGAYVFGRTERFTKVIDGVPRIRWRRLERGQWKVLLRDRHEGYIDWITFERIQAMMANNSLARGRAGSGAARGGEALLGGLLRCRRCGNRIHANYSGARDSRVRRYVCCVRRAEYGEPTCMSFSAVDVDPRVAKMVLDVVRPAAVDASLRAAAHQESAEARTLEALRLECQGARYAADRAWRQYDAIDPANRLVADELERRWNVALEHAREAEARLAMHETAVAQMRLPSAATFQQLAVDLDKVWDAPSTDIRLKKRIVRTLIEQIVADSDDTTHEIVLLIHWKGGLHTELRVPRRRKGAGCRTSCDVVEAVQVLALVCNDGTIAQFLSRAGLRTAKGNAWTRALVTSLRAKRGIPAFSESRRQSEGWLTMEEACALANVAHTTLRRAAQSGTLPARHPLPNGPWVMHRDDVLALRAEHGDVAVDHQPTQLTLAIPRT